MIFLQMAARSLEEELQVWKRHAQMFVRFAKQTIDSSPSQQTQLHEHVEVARNAMIR